MAWCNISQSENHSTGCFDNDLHCNMTEHSHGDGTCTNGGRNDTDDCILRTHTHTDASCRTLIGPNCGGS